MEIACHGKNDSMKYLFLTLAFVVSCASRPCHAPQSKEERKAAQLEAEEKTDTVKPEFPSEVQRVFVAKNNGSKQCGTKKGIAPGVMEKQLKDIKVYSSVSKSDGLIRSQVCGTSSGYFNVYEIDSSNLEKAKALGFQEWK